MPDPTERDTTTRRGTPKPGRERERVQEQRPLDEAVAVWAELLSTPEGEELALKLATAARIVVSRGAGKSGRLAGQLRALDYGLAADVARLLKAGDDWPRVVEEMLEEAKADRAEVEAVDELLAETDRALESAARHGDRTEALLEQIRAVRAETVV